ncbi:MAG: hypothetical protein Q8R29_02665 [bacterium]|nr:hypothetical protein [bacterium]
MLKKNLLFLIIALVLLAGGYLYWQKTKSPKKETKNPATTEPVSTAARGTLPEISPISNPLEKSPEINPVEKANPFTDLYKNPFK